jgi:iron(III) transport system ATP-binding protein
VSTITIERITKQFENGFVLMEDFTLVLEDKKFTTLLGPSGCGKTTLLRLIAGFEKPTKGEIRIGDEVVCSAKSFVPPEKRNVGMVFQSYAVWPHMTVFDNVAYPLKIRKVPKDKIRERVGKVLDTVHLSQYAGRIPSQLSGGQQQRVALARALVAEPTLLLLDEPLSNLDAKLRESMRFEIKEIQKKLDITAVYVTHDQTEAMAMSDNVIVLNNGVVQQVAPPFEIYRKPANLFVASFVGKVNLLRGEATDGRIELIGLGQSLPYDGPYTGKVIVAVRPENIDISHQPGGQLEGTLTTIYYLGDVNDCRVDINGEIIRVITDGFNYDRLSASSKVYIDFKEILVYEDDGKDDQIQIIT